MALITKFLVTLVAAYLALTLIGRATFIQILVIAVVGTALNYLLGDLVLLPVGGNITASICDGLLAVILAFAVMRMWGAFATVSWWALLTFAILVAVFEYFFHNYLKKSDEVAP
ncbi:MAG: DUF2512 family protein [Syntrophomonas sp.]